MPEPTLEELQDRLEYLRPLAAKAAEQEFQLQTQTSELLETQRMLAQATSERAALRERAEAYAMLQRNGMTGDAVETIGNLRAVLSEALNWQRVMLERFERNAPLYKIKGDGEREQFVEIEFVTGLQTMIGRLEAALAVPVDDQ